ncbi:hemerythrin domain-containing protein [Chitinibacter fontanus]|uniref:Hemerythrin domain-containing protein n=1 Tax=Chitinibacter fontanus TaxID=1737446 RepID=A0A7D5VA22_9NEIS|nr:hemerythrin domain-containing protein [Chitinibacter fontanus]QLI81133.1 hemerythrin domain-containing protein [Chitinibacter fontanus]
MLNPFATETVTFETPVAMLIACHDRVRQYAALTETLVSHVAQHGADAAAIAGAQSILRYFDIAAPLHHQDEDEDLFPALIPLASAELKQVIDQIMAEHDELGALWQQVRAALLALVAGNDNELSAELAAQFASRYPAHAAREEDEIYPYAKVLLDAKQLQQLGRNMAARRGQKV